MGDETKSTEALPEVTAPPWLDLDLVERAANHGREDSVKVTGFKVLAATPPGSNYLSAVYRVKAELSDGKQTSMIVKALPAGEGMAAVSAEGGAFPREICALSRALPKMEALLEEAAPGRFQPLAPRLLLSGASPDLFLALEDLSPQGFKMADRCRGLGLRHSLLVLRTLARYHAASAAFLQRDPSIAEELGNSWRCLSAGFKFFVQASIQSVADFLHESPGFQEYATFLEEFKPVAVDVFASLNDMKPDGFNVLVHGDFWVNNMLFRYEDGHPSDIRFVDFQLTHAASPVLDVLLFFVCSVSESVSLHHEDLLVREYHRALSEAMRLLQLEAPSLEALRAAMDAHGPYVVFGATCGLPGIKTAQALDLDAAMMGDADCNTFMFKNPVVRRWLFRVFPEFKRRGWLRCS